MNCFKLDILKEDAEQLRLDTEKECAKIIDATVKTVEFLDTCEKLGLTVVGINEIPEKRIVSWPFRGMGSAFGNGPKSKGGGYHNGSPAIWKAVELHGISGSCGNTGQHSLTKDAPLIDGVYELRKGNWIKR